MTDNLPSVTRRGALLLFGSVPIAGRVVNARADAPARKPIESATVLVAGPDGGSLDRWGRIVTPGLAQGLPPETNLQITSVGAADGVTGANQFATRAEPDGRTVLLVPGAAAVAWLVGDPRAQYDVGHWVSVMAGTTPGVMITRLGAIGPDRKVRLSTPGPASADLPGILGIDLLGSQTVLVPPMLLPAQIDAFKKGEVDAVFLRGYNVSEHAVTLMQAGGVPVFSLGARDETGRLVANPAFPNVPPLPAACAALFGKEPRGPLLDAWSAAAVAAQTEFALILQHLTPPSAIALWRHAGTEATASLDIQAAAMPLGVRLVGGAEASSTGATIAAGQPARQELRQWLEMRFNWRPT